MTATHLIYAAAGRPAMEGDTRGVCRTCEAVAAGVPFDGWVRKTFTDWDKLRPGAMVCQACQFCFSDRNEALTGLTGKDKPQRMRNYSHFVAEGRWIPLSKGDKRRMAELLLAGPAAAVIAESGQKHLIFRAQAGWWQFEETAMWPCPRHLGELLGPVEALYGMGFSKAEIDSGAYPQHKILRAGLDAWQAAEQRIRPARGTAPFSLALFLAQKEDV